MRLPPVVHVPPRGLLRHLPPHHQALLPQARVRHRRRRQVGRLAIVYFETNVAVCLLLFDCLCRKGAAHVSKITDAAVEKAKDYAAEQQLNKSE